MASNDNSAEANALVEQARQMLDAGDWRGALRLLTRARRELANDAAAWALIGDCHVAGEQWRRAVAAYERSLELLCDPDVAQRLQVAREQAAREPFRVIEASPQTLAIIAAALVLTAVAVGIMLWAAFGGRPRQAPAERGVAGQPRPIVRQAPARPRVAGVPASPWQVPSAAPPATRAKKSPQPERFEQPARAPQPQNLPPVHITKRVEAPATDLDYYFTDIIGSLTWPDGTPLSGHCLVQFDPYTGYAFVTITIPRSLKTTNLAQVTLRMAQGVAWALMKADKRVRYVTIRALYALQQPARRATTVVAFRGNTSRVAYEYWQRLGRQPNIQELWNDVFATCWWNPAVPAASEPAKK